MKTQTPMQEAIETLKEAQKHITSKTEYSKGYNLALDDITSLLTELIPKEQQVIEDAFNEDLYYNTDGKYMDGKEYYNTKFKNNKIK